MTTVEVIFIVALENIRYSYVPLLFNYWFKEMIFQDSYHWEIIFISCVVVISRAVRRRKFCVSIHSVVCCLLKKYLPTINQIKCCLILFAYANILLMSIQVPKVLPEGNRCLFGWYTSSYYPECLRVQWCYENQRWRKPSTNDGPKRIYHAFWM